MRASGRRERAYNACTLFPRSYSLIIILFIAGNVLFYTTTRSLSPPPSAIRSGGLCPACPAASSPLCPAAPLCPQVPQPGATLSTTTTTTTINPPSSNAAPANNNIRRGLSRLLSDDELDEFFRIESELSSYAFGLADAEQLIPIMTPIYNGHRFARGLGPSGVGGFIDVGTNIGDVSSLVLESWTQQARRFYLHALALGDDVILDAVHPHPGHQDELGFMWLLEASPTTLRLLQRRYDASNWRDSHVEILHMAAGNASGEQRFCFYKAGSGQSGLADKAADGEGGVNSSDGERNCTMLKVSTLDNLVNTKGGKDARVFFLKVDVEGAEALVLDGARQLIKEGRVSYLLFENHVKWRAAQADLGVDPFRSVGDVVGSLHAEGYTCFYMHPLGLIPYITANTPEGDRARPASACHEGLPFCARHRFYNRQFWSNIFCGGPEEKEWLNWLQDTLLSPTSTRELLLKKAKLASL